MAGKGSEARKSVAGEEYILDSFILLEDQEKILGTLAAPDSMNKGGEVENYRLPYVHGKVEGNQEKQIQLSSLDTLFGLSFRDYKLLLP